MQPSPLPLERCVHLACVLEATARKPGNVHPGASFVDLTYADLLHAAEAAAPVLALAAELGVGRAILEAIRRSRERAATNANLGIVLLIAPLAAVPRDVPLAEGIHDVLRALTVDDAACVYEAIRIVNPGGLGQVAEQDVTSQPRVSLTEAMRLAAERDSIAAEYAERFPRVLGRGLRLLAGHENFADDWERAIVGLHLHLMAECPDTLIARKCGRATADESAVRAQRVLDAGWPDAPESRDQLTLLDDWLRADGHRRNPGTTADLVAAALFAGFRDGLLPTLQADR